MVVMVGVCIVKIFRNTSLACITPLCLKKFGITTYVRCVETNMDEVGINELGLLERLPDLIVGD